MDQYRCSNAVYLLSMLSDHFGVSIDRMIQCPVHGKGEVDGLNAVIKRYFLTCMKQINSPSTLDDDKCNKLDPWLYTNNERLYLASQAVHLCQDPSIKDGVISSADK